MGSCNNYYHISSGGNNSWGDCQLSWQRTCNYCYIFLRNTNNLDKRRIHNAAIENRSLPGINRVYNVFDDKLKGCVLNNFKLLGKSSTKSQYPISNFALDRCGNKKGPVGELAIISGSWIRNVLSWKINLN